MVNSVGYEHLWQSLNTGLRASLVIGCLSASGVMAQSPDVSVDDFREAALDALGDTRVKGLVIEGAGWDACLGQAWSINEGWARWELTDYRRLIDYTNGRSSYSTLKRAEMDPGKAGGCGAQPNASARQQQGYIDSSASWSDQLLIWLTPHGFLELLGEEEAVIEQQTSGWQVTLLLNRNDIDYRFVAEFNEGHEFTVVKTQIDDGVFGNMDVTMDFGDYHTFNDLRFPETLIMSQGGYPTLSLTIDRVAPHNEPVSGSVQRFPAQSEDHGGPAYEEIGPGIFAFHGGYQSVAVEFNDFSVVIDGLQSDSRVQTLITQVKEAIPDKPIRYVVSTHSHFDHAYGLRQFADEGTVILMHEMNVEFFTDALSRPRTLRLEPTEPAEVTVDIQGIDGRYIISDGSGQTLELYTLGPGIHAADMVVAYLPAIKAIVEADVYQPWINPIFSGDGEGPHPYLVYLAEELAQAGIDYERFVPIHVPPDPPLMSREALDDVLSR